MNRSRGTKKPLLYRLAGFINGAYHTQKTKIVAIWYMAVDLLKWPKY